MSIADDAGRAAMLRGFIRAMAANWSGPGWDAERLGFHEQLTDALAPAGAPHRRLHLAARQLYLLCRAPALADAAAPPGRVEAVFRMLVERFQDPVHGGFFCTLDLDGRPLDRRKDLYGQAFVLFALAAYRDISGDPAALVSARRTQALLERHLRRPGGWFAAGAAEDWSVPDGSLVQNPNMHLLEAYLALDAVDGDPLWAENADRLVGVFQRHLYDPGRRLLGEFYDAAGAPHPVTGHQVEPGHQFEWAWLLYAYAARRGIEPLPAASDLIDRAAAIGVDPVQGGLWDRIDRSGAVLLETKRIWPVCEAVKAYASRWRARGDPADRLAMRHWIDFLVRWYLQPNGGWTETLGPDLGPIPGNMPGTTPYHLAMMAAEALLVLTAPG